MLSVWLAWTPTNAFSTQRPRLDAGVLDVGRAPPFGAFGAVGAGLALGAAIALARRARR
jgi:hypothetical protein